MTLHSCTSDPAWKKYCGLEVEGIAFFLFIHTYYSTFFVLIITDWFESLESLCAIAINRCTPIGIICWGRGIIKYETIITLLLPWLTDVSKFGT